MQWEQMKPRDPFEGYEGATIEQIVMCMRVETEGAQSSIGDGKHIIGNCADCQAEILTQVPVPGKSATVILPDGSDMQTQIPDVTLVPLCSQCAKIRAVRNGQVETVQAVLDMQEQFEPYLLGDDDEDVQVLLSLRVEFMEGEPASNAVQMPCDGCGAMLWTDADPYRPRLVMVEGELRVDTPEPGVQRLCTKCATKGALRIGDHVNAAQIVQFRNSLEPRSRVADDAEVFGPRK